jgi:GTP cyclohydrolase I
VRVRHHLTVTAVCPVDGLPDVYAVTVEAERVVRVEDILRVARTFAKRRLYQEQLTEEMARKLSATVRSVGFHSGVRTEVEA